MRHLIKLAHLHDTDPNERILFFLQHLVSLPRNEWSSCKDQHRHRSEETNIKNNRKKLLKEIIESFN